MKGNVVEKWKNKISKKRRGDKIRTFYVKINFMYYDNCYTLFSFNSITVLCDNIIDWFYGMSTSLGLFYAESLGIACIQHSFFF